jgi:hypothetical protein
MTSFASRHPMAGPGPGGSHTQIFFGRQVSDYSLL